MPRSADGERGRVILLARACPRLDSIYHRVCENVWEKIVKGGGQMHSADQTLDRSVFAISALSSELFSASVCVCVRKVSETTARGQLMGGQVSVYRAVAFL